MSQSATKSDDDVLIGIKTIKPWPDFSKNIIAFKDRQIREFTSKGLLFDKITTTKHDKIQLFIYLLIKLQQKLN